MLQFLILQVCWTRKLQVTDLSIYLHHKKVNNKNLQGQHEKNHVKEFVPSKIQPHIDPTCTTQ